MTPEKATIQGRDAVVYSLEAGSELVHVPRYLGPDEASALYLHCEGLAWARQPMRGVLTKRANAWFSERPVDYVYSGQSWPARALTPDLRAVAERLSVAAATAFDCVLATLYPQGDAAVDFHRDDEPIFGEHPTIASLSLGATRVFEVRDGCRGRREGLSIALGDGDLVVMRGAFQERYTHRLKKGSPRVGSRINLSFRRLLPEGVERRA